MSWSTFGARKPLKLKLDLHVHTNKSRDASTQLSELLPNIRRAELDGLAITDHNSLAVETPDGAIFLRGIEISSRDGHIIGLGTSAPVPKGLPMDETIRKIHQLGGVSIVAHPYDFFRSAVNPEVLTVSPDAMEVVNSASLLHSITWKKAKRFAEKNRLPQTAGSDSHIPQTIGKAFTAIECEERTAESILEAIRNGYTTPFGNPYNFRDRARKLLRTR